jgi:hypothetical protein
LVPTAKDGPQLLIQNDFLYVIEEPLVNAPGPNASAQDRHKYREARDIAIEVQTLMASYMEPHLKAYYQNRDPFAMISALQTLFAPQVRNLSYECLNEFISTKMEENTYFGSHLTNMHRVYRRVNDMLNYLITNELVIDVVLQ